ncbi:branched-chain amino acid ABC transporter permease [Pseudanabaena sp. UWO310]|uniref:branched-chain amino acid ABC transporter permease n=1 Tax=Pseudanabaena sp. UWO310 TaxID=2480795 RepID=UPI0011590D84|nr:branched-chain amino acid ABC transporter permease [Pseudanabaena sp. UWO310]TYQ30504.1 branched-chain amino acid ABC transporter permease [Pseudanabaena sp. UWO310]
MNYFLHLFIYFNINAIVALSLNLVMGYCGLLTLAHAGYFALGSYAYALATVKLGWGFFPAVGLGVLLAAVMSLAISLPALRFKGDFFVLVSLAVQTLLFSLLYNWSSPEAEVGTWQNLTNGPFGISGIPRPNLFGWQLDSIGSMAGLAFVTALLCALIVWLLLISPWGRLLKVVRDDELAARGLGKNTRLAKMQAVAIACGMAAVAGSLYAAYVNYIDPSTASLDESILMTCMVLVGGVGNFRGPLVGAFILLAIPEALRFAAIPDAVAANIRLGVYGLLLVLMMQFRPQGIAGDYRID